MKKVIGIVAGLIVLLVIIAVVAIGAGVYFFGVSTVEKFAKQAIERGGTQALGVNTTVSGVDLNLRERSVALSTLNIANPEGNYKTDRFFSLDGASVRVSDTILQDVLDKEGVITVPELAFDGIVVNLERSPDGANYQRITDNLKKLESKEEGETAPPPAEEESVARKFVVERMVFTDITIEARMLGSGQDNLEEATKVVVTVPEVELTDIGSAADPKSAGEIASIAFKTLMQTAIEAGNGQIPDIILGDLQDRLSALLPLDKMGVGELNLENATQLVDDVAKEAVEQVENVTKDVTEKVDEAVKDGTKQIEEGLRNLLPGQKKEESENQSE